MESLSVVVTAYNCAATVGAALQSVLESVAFFRREASSASGVTTEVVVVDDGSTDETHREIAAVAAGRDDWKVVRHDQPGSPSRARNAGVRESRGQILFFLDGDDLFLPPHLAVCWQVLAERDIDYVKTGVRLADPVHADWKKRIENTLVVNLCIRRRAHEALGGFPDYRLFRCDGDRLHYELDVFYKIEDVFYNRLAGRVLRGCKVVRETVQYCRREGNAYDRQYEKFRRPFAEAHDTSTVEERLRIRLAEPICRDFLLPKIRMRRDVGEEGASLRRLESGQVPESTFSSSEAKALTERGIHLAGQGRIEEAVDLLQRAVALRPDSSRSQHNLGVALAQLGRRDEAVASLEEALRLRPDYADAYFNLGNVLREMGRCDEAMSRFRQALQFQPDHASACNNLGLTLTEANRPEEALVPLRRAVAFQAEMKESHNNLGLAYADLGRFAEAEACYQEALRLDPGYAEAHTNLGSAYKEQGRLEEALSCYQYALWLEPNSAVAHYNRALAWLQMGDYESGWPEYEWRWRRRQARQRSLDRPRWDGKPLDGRTILLWREQGLGDTIQFVRYAAVVARQGGRVIVECPSCLVALLSSCGGIDRLVAEKQPLPEFEVHASLLDLPGLLRTTMATVPATIPYLRAESGRVTSWRRRLGDGGVFRVGVVWQGNPWFRGDRHRSFPLTSLAPLARIKGVRLFSLQKEHGLEQLRSVERRFPLEILEGLDGVGGAFLDTAAVMQNLDLVVTADTAAAHVAGALGVPVWVALSRVPDWRWGLTGATTPWYPSMRLFRQTQLGDWRSVFEVVAARLQREVDVNHPIGR